MHHLHPHQHASWSTPHHSPSRQQMWNMAHQKPYDYTWGSTHVSLGNTCAASGTTTTMLWSVWTQMMHVWANGRKRPMMWCMQPRSEPVVMQCATTISKEETAFKQQPGLRCGFQVHAVSPVKVVEAVKRWWKQSEKFCDLSACPRPWAHAACLGCWPMLT